jgi:signal peptidase
VVKIVEIEGLLYFQTKGDANEEPDPSLVSAKGDKMEKVVFHIPYLGFVAQFMKSGYAFPALVGIPAIVLTIISIRDIKHGIREIRRKRKVNTVGVK